MKASLGSFTAARRAGTINTVERKPPPTVRLCTHRARNGSCSSQNCERKQFLDLYRTTGESGVLRNFGLGGKAEGFHFSDVLSFRDEFREDIGYGRIQEKSRQPLA